MLKRANLVVGAVLVLAPATAYAETVHRAEAQTYPTLKGAAANASYCVNNAQVREGCRTLVRTLSVRATSTRARVNRATPGRNVKCVAQAKLYLNLAYADLISSTRWWRNPRIFNAYVTLATTNYNQGQSLLRGPCRGPR